MTTQHTQGPWKIVEREVLEDGSVYPRHILGGRFQMQVCLMESAAAANAFVNEPSWKNLGNSEISISDARLIAASPLMLDELIKLKKLLEAISLTDYPVSDELDSIAAVIAKATEETK